MSLESGMLFVQQNRNTGQQVQTFLLKAEHSEKNEKSLFSKYRERTVLGVLLIILLISLIFLVIYVYERLNESNEYYDQEIHYLRSRTESREMEKKDQQTMEHKQPLVSMKRKQSKGKKKRRVHVKTTPCVQNRIPVVRVRSYDRKIRYLRKRIENLEKQATSMKQSIYSKRSRTTSLGGKQKMEKNNSHLETTSFVQNSVPITKV